MCVAVSLLLCCFFQPYSYFVTSVGLHITDMNKDADNFSPFHLACGSLFTHRNICSHIVSGKLTLPPIYDKSCILLFPIAFCTCYSSNETVY